MAATYTIIHRDQNAERYSSMFFQDAYEWLKEREDVAYLYWMDETIHTDAGDVDGFSLSGEEVIADRERGVL